MTQPADQSSVYETSVPTQQGNTLHWAQLYGSASSIALSKTCSKEPLIVYISNDLISSESVTQEIRFFNQGQHPIFAFPDSECLAYDRVSPHPDISSQRLQTLAQLITNKAGFLSLPVSALIQKLPPKQFIQEHSFLFRVNDECSIEAFREQLMQASYYCVDQVLLSGEFAVRGGIIDVFPSGQDKPFRLDLFGTTIESIKYFDPETQRSLDSVENITILPAKEFSLNPSSVQLFRQNFRESFEGNASKTLIYQEISKGVAPSGSEFYLPLFHSHTETLFDYLEPNTLFVFEQGTLEKIDTLHQDINERYENAQLDSSWPPLAPNTLFITKEQVFTHLKKHRKIELIDLNLQQAKHLVKYDTQPIKQFHIDPRKEAPYVEFIQHCQSSKQRILILTASEGRQAHLKKVLLENEIHLPSVQSWSEFEQSDIKLAITNSHVERGCNLNNPSIQIICENQLYGRQQIQKRSRSTKNKDPESIIRSLAELDIGDPVVHDEHGVGRYRGLETLTIGTKENEFAVLEYAEGGKIYIPVLSLHLVSRYIGGNPDTAPLHKMGSDIWQKSRSKAKQKAYDVAVELLELQALRESRNGHSFSLSDHQYEAFASGFSFTETADQAQVIDDVINDMKSAKSMDRLVCGDVGFGKTEIALRATFIAAMEGKQVAMLVPTTLLAQQHFENFSNRFAKWPINIELLSRFKTKKQIDTILEGLKNGNVDVVIGTHKLLQNSVKFKQLGLMVVDEEHRFGVRQKEQLKKLRSQVDILTLTATPIPRTLNFALSGLRDISIIATPPKTRLSVKTLVREWNDGIIKDAILREIRRGGQVYVLHNEVQTIEKLHHQLSNLVPDANIRIGHGQMQERELESIMRDFHHQRFNILLCTTIIESGIDVPSANTIIINRADRFGLAQLHQLRGRVGRSHHQAYAYMITPSYNSLTEDAKKRLSAIDSLDTLGAGFALASQDLEIRGAGELLGESQSGMIDQIGYSLYNRYLEQAISDIKKQKNQIKSSPNDTSKSELETDNIEINLDLTARFPEDYIANVRLRLNLYKRIANAKTSEELDDLSIEMIDRFGLLPDATKHLLRVTAIKLKAEKIGVISINIGEKGGSIQFKDEPNIDVSALMNFLSENRNTIKLDGNQSLQINDQLLEEEQRLILVETIIQTIKNND